VLLTTALATPAGAASIAGPWRGSGAPATARDRRCEDARRHRRRGCRLLLGIRHRGAL